MANICNYHVCVKGTKNTAYLVYYAMPAYEDKTITQESGTPEQYELWFTGNCKWSVNFGVTEKWDIQPEWLDSLDEGALEGLGLSAMNVSLGAKSKVLHCEILAHYWSAESEFDQFDQYVNGKCVKQRKIPYSWEVYHSDKMSGRFDWETLEFKGFEGVCDESVKGEENDSEFMSSINALFGLESSSSAADFEVQDDSKPCEFVSAVQKKPVEAKPMTDLYNWSFTSGKRVSRDDWSIALPNGFQEIISDSGRSFEAIPEKESFKEAKDCSIHILSGEKTDSSAFSDCWFKSETSRAAYASLVGTYVVNQLHEQLGMQCIVEGIAFEDMAAHVIRLHTPNGRNYQCTVYCESDAWTFRLDVKTLTPRQDADLTKSVIAWIKTFRTNRSNRLIQRELPLSAAAVYSSLMLGQFETFDKAVDAAVNEFKVSVAGPTNALQLKADLGLLNDSAKDEVKKYLQAAQAVLESHYLCADQLIDKIAAQPFKRGIIDRMLSKLKSLDECVPDIAVQSEKVVIPESKTIRDIRKKWQKYSGTSKPAEKTGSAKPANAGPQPEVSHEDYARQRRTEADRKVAELLAELKRKKDLSKRTYDRQVGQHKWEIEHHTFSGPWDPELRTYFSRMDNDLQTYGSEVEALVTKAIEDYTGLRDQASEKEAATLAEWIIKEIEDLTGSSIDNNDLGLSFHYRWKKDMSEKVAELKNDVRRLRGRGVSSSVPKKRESTAVSTGRKELSYQSSAQKEVEEQLERQARLERYRKRQEEAAKKQEAEDQSHWDEIKDALPEKRERSRMICSMVSAWGDRLACVSEDGSVRTFTVDRTADGGTQFMPGRFSELRSVVCKQNGIVGARKDGSCVADGQQNTIDISVNVCESWKDIIELAAGEQLVVGLKKDGTCEANGVKWIGGSSASSGVSGWSDVTKIACGKRFVIGLKKNGTVSFAHTDGGFYASYLSGVENWRNVELIAAGFFSAAGLTRDGKLLTTGKLAVGGLRPYKGIIQLAILGDVLYALYADGTVAGGESHETLRIQETNVAAIYAADKHLYILTEDGHIRAYKRYYGTLLFEGLQLFEDADRLAAARKREDQYAEEKRAEEARLAAERKALAEQQACEKKALLKKKLKKLMFFLIPLIIICILLFALYPKVIKPTIEKETRYQQANALMKNGEWEEAKSIFLGLEDYRKAQELAQETDYRKAVMYLEQEEFDTAIGIWESISAYSDSAERAEQALFQWKDADYQRAVSLVEQGAYEEAVQSFAELGDYLDSAVKQQEAQLLQNQKVYSLAEEFLNNGQFEEAIAYFEQLSEFKDAPARAAEASYAYGTGLMQAENYEAAADHFKKAANYQDAEEQYLEAVYQFGSALLQKEDYAGAIAQFTKCRDHSDAAQKLLDAKFRYVSAHKEEPDQVTKSYLDELMEAKYKGIQKLYDEVYAWTAVIVGIGTDPFDNNTVIKRIGRPSEVWCTWQLSGGAPQKTVDLYVLVRTADGQTLRQNFSKCESGEKNLVQLFGLSPYMAAGNITFSVYLQNGKLLASESTYWG